ncbi:MAG: hypothetical protein M1827_001390 [Pycnora praestabilis]|nr:MAG: hypothetical protein M1827_001390 [Pycnora praestabilis]
MATTSPQPFSFLALPPEIRNKIYLLLLTCPPGRGRTAIGTLNPSILSTNSQIWTEAQGILYGDNVFTAHPSLLNSMPHLLHTSKPILSHRVIQQIQRYRLRMRLDCDPFYDAEALAKAFSGVEVLEIEVWQAQYGSCDEGLLEIFRGIRGVGKARVWGSVSGEYAHYLERSMMCEAGAASPCFERKGKGAGRVGRYDVWIHGGR